MVTCRTINEVLAAADADSVGEPPMSQAAADRVAVILAAAVSGTGWKDNRTAPARTSGLGAAGVTD
jgi:hypothetical protein